MLKLTNKNINCYVLNRGKDGRECMKWQDEEFPQRNRIYRNNEVDILELQSIISEIKDSLDRLNRLHIKKKISELDYRSVKII